MENSTSLVPMEHNNQRILITEQLARAYGTDENHIKNNYNNNKDRYTEGKHFYRLEGNALRHFLDLQVKNLDLQNPEKIRTLYLWTEKGAWLHAKSLNTDKAWEAYEMLVDEYYRLREQPQLPPAQSDAFSYHVQITCNTSVDIRRAKGVIQHLEQAQAIYDGKKTVTEEPVTKAAMKQLREAKKEPLEDRIMRCYETNIGRFAGKMNLRDMMRYLKGHSSEELYVAVMILVKRGELCPVRTGRTTYYYLKGMMPRF